MSLITLNYQLIKEESEGDETFINDVELIIDEFDIISFNVAINQSLLNLELSCTRPCTHELDC